MGTIRNVAMFLTLAFIVSQLTQWVAANGLSREENCGQVYVVLYTTASCGYCAKARRFLNRNNVAWCEKDINRSKTNYREYRALRGRGVPLAQYDRKHINGRLQGGQVMSGFSEQGYADAFLSQ